MMALSKDILVLEIFSLFETKRGVDLSAQQKLDINPLIESIAEAVISHIIANGVTVASGIAVATTGTAAAQAGTTTGPGVGSIA
jgi:hypothetical protein